MDSFVEAQNNLTRMRENGAPTGLSSAIESSMFDQDRNMDYAVASKKNAV
jgi:hypothetical protein